MRDFPPRTASRRTAGPFGLTGRTVAIGAALVLTAGAAAAPSVAEDLRHKQRTLQASEQKVQNDLDESSQGYRNAQHQLSVARARLRTAQNRMAGIQSKLKAAEAADLVWQKRLSNARTQLAKAQRELADGKAAVAAQRKVVLDNALRLYQQGPPQLQQLQALLQSGSATDMSRQLAYNQAFSQVQSNTYDGLTSAESALGVRAKQVSDAEHQVAVGASRSRAQVLAVRDLQHQAAVWKTQVTAQVRAGKAAVKAAEAAKAHDAAVLQSLQAQEARVIAKILAQGAGSRSGVATGGMFLRPLVGGVLTSPFGWRVHPIYHYWGLHNGDDFAAPCGTPEVAVDTGRVAAEYYSSVWGNRLFLNLGNIDGHNYTVIYNHLARYAVGVGQIVTRGQAIGYEGTTGWSTGCHLHFTVLRDGVAVNPMNYIN